jgi:hypothetical protein
MIEVKKVKEDVKEKIEEKESEEESEEESELESEEESELESDEESELESEEENEEIKIVEDKHIRTETKITKKMYKECFECKEEKEICNFRKHARGHRKKCNECIDYVPKVCVDCDIKVAQKSTRCNPCNYKYRITNDKNRKIKNRPSLEKLEEMVKKMSYVAVGKKYGVSDNSIRKWIRNMKKVK